MHAALKLKYPDEEIPSERTIYHIMERIGVNHRKRRKPNGIIKSVAMFPHLKLKRISPSLVIGQRTLFILMVRSLPLMISLMSFWSVRDGL